jgi:cell division septation protein DedD
MASRVKRGAGERVLESRHVIGLFLLMLLFSGIFFTLGYVMGRNQYDGQVRASTAPRDGVTDPLVAPKPLPGKHGNTASQVAVTGSAKTSANDTTLQKNPGWDMHDFETPKKDSDRLEPGATTPPTPKGSAASVKNASAVSTQRGNPKAPLVPLGSYTLQVAAVTNQADALDLAARLQRKKFPAFVLSPQEDKFYRVQVGPYADQKAADVAKKGLDTAGFKAIVKH